MDPKEIASYAATPEVNEYSGFKKARKRPALKGYNRERKFSLGNLYYFYSISLQVFARLSSLFQYQFK